LSFNLAHSYFAPPKWLAIPTMQAFTVERRKNQADILLMLAFFALGESHQSAAPLPERSPLRRYERAVLASKTNPSAGFQRISVLLGQDGFAFASIGATKIRLCSQPDPEERYSTP
jgi:hypothetical protein